jgi:hypothetical protein
VLATAGLLLALLLLPMSVDLLLRVYAVVMGAIAVSFVLSLTPLKPVSAATPPRRSKSHVSDGREVAELADLERAVAFGLTSGMDLHHRLRPALRRIAAERLARAGVDMNRQPQQALALLGAEAWDLLRPERPPPARRSKGASAASLERVVTALEHVGPAG